jgi:response regulator RpfG family c-di-GMP phosphodiesterase/serine/threonine protein kinase
MITLSSEFDLALPAQPDASGVPNPFLQELLDGSIIPADDWLNLPASVRDELAANVDRNSLLKALTAKGLLTEYQVARAEKGMLFGMVLGNYRLLERLGAGGMGVVYLCEHIVMRRKVAVKVVSDFDGQTSPQVLRFYSEMRAVAKIQHPNIVNALDAGKVVGDGPDTPVLHYFVMEHVPGQDLESLVRENGPLPVDRACDLIHQIASALHAAHQRNLIHRDIKPSNIIITPDNQAKLLDFGLARQFRNRLTDPGTLLGTPDYMAPEQIEDATRVGPSSDIFGLGGVLYWCLTASSPFPCKNLYKDLVNRLVAPPPSVRGAPQSARSDVPPELDDVIARMMAIKADDRYPSAEAVLQALVPFLSPVVRDRFILSGGKSSGEALWKPTAAWQPADGERERAYRVLIVDDDSFTRMFCKTILSQEGIECGEALDGPAALAAIKEKAYDLVLLDVQMPGMTGAEVCRRLREQPPQENPGLANLKIVMLSGTWKSDEMAQIMLAGANDFLTKPTTKLQLLARVKAALELKEAQDRSAALNQKLLGAVHELGQTLQGRETDILRARKGLVLALANIGEQRGLASRGHASRMQQYCRCLAEELAESQGLGEKIDQNFIDTLEICAPLHNLGNIFVPEELLSKPGKLGREDMVIIQSHTDLGAAVLQEVAKHYNFSAFFLRMAADITRHHHERYDGTGYPDGLQGTAIPLAARILAIADAYDAIRTRRPYKSAFPHAVAVQKIETSAGQFDPLLVQGFLACAPHFEKIYRDLAD